ncbi:hypothetical protein NQ315_014816 [Exocentrus adspersus]|uniref:MULE transposase domain-containing protein n=1 Tax=Exocentrus adspersus TaxID=1586481 RepID=A0AAV8VM65_9CUCU|nr:hypothetical protein NQ315_014816 [Exocentrus adspersus]
MDEYPHDIKKLIDSEDVVETWSYEHENNYCLTIRTKKKNKDGNISNSEWCNSWIAKYSTETKTNWIVRYTYPNPQKYEYKKIESQHNHQTQVAEAFSYLRVTNETKELFWKYFDEGMTPSCAKSYHELILEQNDENVIKVLSNTQDNLYSVSHFRWFSGVLEFLLEIQKNLRKVGGRDNQSILTIIKQKSKTYEDFGIKICINEQPLIIVILTPIMLRAHNREFTKEMIFVDSSGSCDQMNSCVTFVFAAHKIGSIPLACIIHTEQSEANYTLIFSLLQKSLGKEGFGQKGFPAVIMTDDSSAERNALRTFHLCQAFWRWLWDSSHNIE